MQGSLPPPLYLSSRLLALLSPEQAGLGTPWPQSPPVGGRGGAAVAITPRGVQVEQPVLPVCAAVCCEANGTWDVQVRGWYRT